MSIRSKPISILLAEDDPDDALMVQEALNHCRLTISLTIVDNGEELLNYLRHTQQQDHADTVEPPRLILLDLNMPRMNGREVLAEIKRDPRLRCIPIVVLTTSQTDDDINRSYELGANSFITKPMSFESLVDTMQTLTKYWFEIVEPPSISKGEKDVRYAD